MIAGVHYVEMTLLDKVHGLHAKMGVVRHFNGQGFNAATGGYAHQQGWLLDTADGNLCYYSTRGRWAGMPQSNEIKQGDVVGLLLDLEQRTLSAFLNGARLGVMAAPGMKNIYDPVDGPSAPLCWAVELDGRIHIGATSLASTSVRIERRTPPGPVPTAEEVAAAVAWCQANYPAGLAPLNLSSTVS